MLGPPAPEARCSARIPAVLRLGHCPRGGGSFPFSTILSCWVSVALFWTAEQVEGWCPAGQEIRASPHLGTEPHDGGVPRAGHLCGVVTQYQEPSGRRWDRLAGPGEGVLRCCGQPPVLPPAPHQPLQGQHG